MVTTHKVILASSLSLLLASVCAAQDDPCLHRAVAVSVLDREGKPVAGLAPQDFRAEAKGKSVKILNVKPDDTTHRAIVVLDSSGSMAGVEQLWKVARSFASDALAASTGRFLAGLIVFNDRVRVRVPPAADPQEARRALEALPDTPNRKDARIGRRTALLDALKSGAEMLEPTHFGDSLLAITDAGENGSDSTLKAIRNTLLQDGIRLHVEWFFHFEGARPTVEEANPIEFLELVRDSGGLFTRIGPSFSALASAAHPNSELQRLETVHATARPLYSAIQFPYRLEVAAPDRFDKPQKWTLSIAQRNNVKPPWILAYPQRLEACASSTPRTD